MTNLNEQLSNSILIGDNFKYVWKHEFTIDNKYSSWLKKKDRKCYYLKELRYLEN